MHVRTVFCSTYISGEKSSKSSAATGNNKTTIADEQKTERMDLLFRRQLLEYGCSEYNRCADQTKELYDGSFKTDMPCT